MKRKIIVITASLMAVMLMAGCGDSENKLAAALNDSGMAATTASVSTAAQTASATAETTAATSAEAVVPSEECEKIDLTGYYLDDAIRLINKCGVDSAYIEYYSDNGKSIIVKNNWVVISQSVHDRRIYLECTKGRSDGILDSIKEVGKGAVQFIDEVERNAEKIRNASGSVDYILDFFKF